MSVLGWVRACVCLRFQAEFGLVGWMGMNINYMYLEGVGLGKQEITLIAWVLPGAFGRLAFCHSI